MNFFPIEKLLIEFELKARYLKRSNGIKIEKKNIKYFLRFFINNF